MGTPKNGSPTTMVKMLCQVPDDYLPEIDEVGTAWRNELCWSLSKSIVWRINSIFSLMTSWRHCYHLGGRR